MGIETAIIAGIAAASTAYGQKRQRDSQREARQDQKEASALLESEEQKRKEDQDRLQTRDEAKKRQRQGIFGTGSSSNIRTSPLGIIGQGTGGLAYKTLLGQ